MGGTGNDVTAAEAPYPGRWWHMLGDGRLQCDLCPRDCRLHEGQRGACFVRQRLDDRMVLTTYGRSSGFCLDPIEKKPLNHFFPGSSVLSFGTAGCNLACKFCQNWDISKSRDMDRLMDLAGPDQIAAAAEARRQQERRVHLQRSGDLRRVRDGCRRCVSCPRHPHGSRHRGLHARRAAARVLREDGRGQCGPQGIYRRVLRQAHRFNTAAGARYAEVPASRDRRLVRDHDAADPDEERFGRGVVSAVEVDREGTGQRRASAFHRVPSGLQTRRPAVHASLDAHACAKNRPRGGIEVRLHRQRARQRRRNHVLSRLRHRSDRARLASDPGLPGFGRGTLHQLRHGDRGPLRQVRKTLRSAAHPGFHPFAPHRKDPNHRKPKKICR